MEDILVPITFFAIIPAIVLIVQAYGHSGRKQIQETIRVAISNGQTLSPETIKALGAKPAKSNGDLRWGVILLAIALAFITLAFAIPAGDLVHGGIMNETIWPLVGVAAFPGLVGIALIALHFMLRETDEEPAATPTGDV